MAVNLKHVRYSYSFLKKFLLSSDFSRFFGGRQAFIWSYFAFFGPIFDTKINVKTHSIIIYVILRCSFCVKNRDGHDSCLENIFRKIPMDLPRWIIAKRDVFGAHAKKWRCAPAKIIEPPHLAPITVTGERDEFSAFQLLRTSKLNSHVAVTCECLFSAKNDFLHLPDGRINFFTQNQIHEDKWNHNVHIPTNFQ
jgi:hypothetical protein